MKRSALAPLLLLAFVSIALAASEQEVVNNCAGIIRDFQAMPEKNIPRSVLRNARGLAIIQVVKVGFGIS
ncbi:MAG: hypothetical protein ACXV8A_06850, partial [Chthoniobacterales bacterium]